VLVKATAVDGTPHALDLKRTIANQISRGYVFDQFTDPLWRERHTVSLTVADDPVVCGQFNEDPERAAEMGRRVRNGPSFDVRDLHESLLISVRIQVLFLPSWRRMALISNEIKL
jgi:hypothetical protein